MEQGQTSNKNLEENIIIIYGGFLWKKGLEN